MRRRRSSRGILGAEQSDDGAHEGGGGGRHGQHPSRSAPHLQQGTAGEDGRWLPAKYEPGSRPWGETTKKAILRSATAHHIWGYRERGPWAAYEEDDEEYEAALEEYERQDELSKLFFRPKLPPKRAIRRPIRST